LFGTLRLDSPRWHQCDCRPQTTRTFSPLATLLSERTTPELVYLESKFVGLVSYGLTADILGAVLPLGRPLHATTARRHVQAVASRLEDELGPEQWSFIEGCEATWKKLPRPDLPLTVSLDGGFVHSAAQTSRRDGWFEVIAGTSTPAEGPGKAFGFVQTYDTKPRRRLFEVLRLVVVAGGVAAGGVVAASDVAALLAHSEVDPASAGGQALVAAVVALCHRGDGVEVSAGRHGASLGVR
jgi:hypothetical protein